MRGNAHKILAYLPVPHNVAIKYACEISVFLLKHTLKHRISYVKVCVKELTWNTLTTGVIKVRSTQEKILCFTR